LHKINIMEKKDEKQLFIITGCDSGIGESVCKLAVGLGYSVCISYLEHNPFEREKNVYAKKMDLRIEKEIDGFAAFVMDICRKEYQLTCLFNNAGVALGGPIENLPLHVYRENFQVNLFGLIALTQKLIPLLIRDKGMIVNNGSLAGKIALPFLAPYASSKFALEGYTDSLRREMRPYGIKTVLIEPAAVATPIWNKSKEQDDSFVDKKFKESLNEFQKKFVEPGNSGLNPDVAARQILKIIRKKKPKARYIIAKNRLLSRLQLLIPVRILDKLLNKIFSMDYGNN
jgi:short-subunit dehydrogenase